MAIYRLLKSNPFTILLRSALVCLCLFCSFEASAEMTVRGNTLVFTQTSSKKSEFEACKEVVSFENTLIFTGTYPVADLASTHTLMENLKRKITQGVKFAVSGQQTFAILLSYYCTQPLIGAEFPYTCDSTVFVVDAEGSVQETLRGNFLWIIPHDTLPYFALVEDFCCSDTGKTSLYTLEGQKVCEGYLGLQPDHLTGTEFTCGTDWENGVLLDKNIIRLQEK
jgi:hypothetical protein